MSTLDSLRGVLPDDEILAMEAILAEMEEATASPQALRRWEWQAAREAAEQAMWEAMLRQRQREHAAFRRKARP